MTRAHWFVGAICLIVGLVAGRLTSRRDGVGAGFAALGLVAGLSLGLSASPVLGATITALFTFLGVLAPLYLKSRNSTASSGPNTNLWLFPFACALAVGIVGGIAMRVNDALDFRSVNLRDRYAELGFSERQIEVMMDKQASTGAPLAERHRDTSLQNLKRPANWDEVLNMFVHKDSSPEDNLASLKQRIPTEKEILREIEKWEKQGLSAKQILKKLEQLEP